MQRLFFNSATMLCKEKKKASILGDGLCILFQQTSTEMEKIILEICAEDTILLKFLCKTDLCKILKDLLENDLI